MNWRLAATLLALALAVLVLRGCGGEDGTTVPGSVLNRGVGPEPDSLSPHAARSAEGHAVLRDLFEGLLSYSPDGRLVEGVAESWETSDDGLTYRFRLRPDARWSNGDPLTADDFVYSLRRLVDPATASTYAAHLSTVVNTTAIVAGNLPPDRLGVAAPGPHEVVFTLELPTAHFPLLLTQPPTFPVHAASVEEHGREFTRPGNLVSNGAYRLAGLTLGTMIELERNEHYWNDAETTIGVVRYHVTDEPVAELNRYRAGELDITSTVPTGSFAQLVQTHADQLHVDQVLNVYYYGFNLAHPDLAKPALRRALSLAIDREVLVRDILARGEAPAYSFVPPGTSNYDPPQLPAAQMTRDEQVALARRLYADAGYGPGNPLEIELRFNTTDTHRRVALAVQADWKDVLEFEAKLIDQSFPQHLQTMQAKQVTQIFRSSWRGDYDDAYSFLHIFRSRSNLNFFNYANPDVDKRLDDASALTNPTARRLYLEETEEEILSDLPVIPLYFYVSKHLVRPTIRGWDHNVLDYHYSQHLSFDTDR